MNIQGMGIVCAGGIGVENFERALRQGWQKPEQIQIPHLKNKKTPVYRVNLTDANEKNLLKKMRRSDKLSKMAVIAANEALGNSGIVNINRKNIGIITATAFGAHVTTFSVLDDILEYGESRVSPTTFSNSVHNAAASYISSALGIEGPTLTVTQFFFSFHSALQLAQTWLSENRCEYILVGAIEQYGDVQAYIHDTKLKTAPDGRIRPFDFSPAFQVPGEGSAFFLLGTRKTDNVICEIQSISMNPDVNDPLQRDLDIIDTDGLLENESVYRRSLSNAVPAAAYSPLFGSMMSGSAFNFAAGALMLKKQMRYANPVTDNPHGINLVMETRPSDIELIRCLRYNCYQKSAVIYISKI